MEQKFTDKNYLITGATSGLGNAASRALLESGAKVLGIGRDKSKISDFIQAYPDNFVFLELDLSSEFSIEPSISEFVNNNGKFHGYVNCAGKEETMPVTMYTPQLLKSIFDVNFNAPFEILRLLSKKKFSEESASFVLIASVMSQLGQPAKTGYCSSKAALLGLVKSAALELASRKIRVNAISPGVVDTPMTQKLFSQIEEQNVNRIVGMHPLGIGSIDDITPLILFLLSADSRWITGQNIMIDGGYSIQ
ncbi:MAG TPA: SDR family oxidoreductase [Flavobacterium sp.]|jgi:NAD(P)-dependent dehydrogenase (short-subunit alcohol dehydrogenase family)